MEKDVKEFSTATEKLIQVDIEKEMRESFLQYSMAVLVSRALPDVRDGMKPVHRRIIYTMNEADNTSSKPYRKCAYTVGEVLGKYHPHGDASVYDALVRLAQDFSMRYPLIRRSRKLRFCRRRPACRLSLYRSENGKDSIRASEGYKEGHYRLGKELR